MEFAEFSIEVVYLSISLVVLLIFSGLISGSETALFSLSPTELEAIEEQNTPSSNAILKLRENQDTLLSTILIFNNLIDISAILVASSIVGELFVFTSSTWEFTLKVLASTFVVLLFGEIMPKVLATYHPRGFSSLVARPLVALRKLLWPLSWVLINASALITKLLSPKQEGVSMDKLQEAIEIAQSETEEDKKMLSGIVRFSGTEVVEIMKPRVDVVAIENDWDFLTVKEVIVKSGFSRFPVYEDSFDKVLGILFIKDLIPHIDESADFEWQKLIREPFFVPENKKINDLLEDFQAKRQHLCIVVDEYGGSLGIATLEDVLEEVVGDITDESDSVASFYKELSAGVYLFDGSTHLVDFVRVMSLDEQFIDAHKGEADTLAGLMLELKGDFLKLGEVITLGVLTLTAENVQGYRITKVLVHSKR